MIVHITNTIRNAIMVWTRDGKVSQSTTTLNSGSMIKADYVQKLPENKGNIHVIDGSVILNIDRDHISFDKKQNNKYIAAVESGEDIKEVSTPNLSFTSLDDSVPRPKKSGGCCGGKR